MTKQELLSQEQCNKIYDSIHSDLRVVEAKQQVNEAGSKVLGVWREIITKRVMGGASEDRLREVIPLEEHFLILRMRHLNVMKEVFEENQSSYGLPTDASFFDFYAHPVCDEEIMWTIENLIKYYQKVRSYRKDIKKLVQKMKRAGIQSVNMGGTMLVTMEYPQGVFLLEEEEKLKVGLAIYLVEIERVKLAIKLVSYARKDLGKRFLSVLKTFPTTTITEKLAAYFKSLKGSIEKASSFEAAAENKG